MTRIMMDAGVYLDTDIEGEKLTRMIDQNIRSGGRWITVKADGGDIYINIAQIKMLVPVQTEIVATKEDEPNDD